MTKGACKILGIGLVLAGIAGYFNPNLLGLHLTPSHNFIHLLVGALTLYFGFTDTIEAAQVFCRVFGAIYLIAGILGFVAPEAIERIVQIPVTVVGLNLTPDNIVHLLVGAIFLIVGFLPEPHRAMPTGVGGQLK